MNTELLLECEDKSILIIEDRDRKEIVIAAPHHAPLGVAELPCTAHKDADENAGVLGYYTASLLNCCSVIACNYFLDVNKAKESDYFKKIQLWKPDILVEIHGHGGNSAKFDIEISSGSINRNIWSQELAKKLTSKLSTVVSLQKLTISGDLKKIYFKAKKTLTITTKDWVAFHIELPITIRAEKSNYIVFCETLAEALSEILENYEELKKLENENAT
jgi:hypothetical protein